MIFQTKNVFPVVFMNIAAAMFYMSTTLYKSVLTQITFSSNDKTHCPNISTHPIASRFYGKTLSKMVLTLGIQ
jgi:hypothetical protein